MPQGSFLLDRHPPVGNRPLRAWDAADELLLDHLHTTGRVTGGRVLVVNDSSGALTVALGAAAGTLPTFLTDSHVSVLATRANLARNGMDPEGLVVLGGPEGLGEQLGSGAGRRAVDVVVIKVPKSLGLLEHQLHQLRQVIDGDTLVVAGAMTRHLHRGALDLFESSVGPTVTSQARKKARLVHPSWDEDARPGPSPWPRSYRLDDGTEVVNHAGVHAAGRLDPGTRFLLEHLPKELPQELRRGTIVDLGCGDGVVGLQLARLHPDASVVLVDESLLAIASARETFALNGVDAARFEVADVLGDLEGGEVVGSGSVDLVVVNPPFHADHAISDEIAWRMLVQSHEALRPGGEVLVIGNRHLGHHTKLRRIFGGYQVVASNPKFVVCRAQRR